MYRLSDISPNGHGGNKMNCGPCGSGNRNFMTKEEKVEMLDEYKESLEKELQGVKERIKELGKE